MTASIRVEHVALWTPDLERMRAFYEQWFDARANDRYESATTRGFASYFLSFGDGGARVELMTRPTLAGADGRLAGSVDAPTAGYVHIAISLGSRDRVDALAARMTADGVPVVSAPRQTGDGYYEAVVQDPDGNLIEITA